MKEAGNKKDLSLPVAEIKRHMSILSEDFKDQIKIVAEQYSSLDTKVDDIKKTLGSHTETIGEIKKTVGSHTEILDSHTETLKSHTEMIGKLMVNMEIVKSDIQIIKADLKKKVDYDEFSNLVKRVERLEARK